MTRFADFSRQTLLIKIAIAGIFFSAMTALKTYPLIFRLRTHFLGGPGDELLNTWILAWDFHALTTDLWNLFNANIFYPASTSLAFSEHMIGVLPLYAPAYTLTGNPIFAYNTALVLSFPLSGIAMFILVHNWTRNFWASLLSGGLFAFAPIRLQQLGHFQLLNLYWAPLALLFWEKFLRSRRWRDLTGFAICYWWQVLCSIYLGWFTTIMVVIYASSYTFFIDLKLLSRSMFTKWITFGALSVFVLLPFHLPYYVVKQQWGFFRSLQECIFFSADLLLSYLNVPSVMNDFYLSGFRFASELSSPGENWLFPGLVLPFLVILGSLPIRRLCPSPGLGHISRSCWIILISSFILSLGPFLVVLGRNTHIPLPYLFLYHVVPGFRTMRVPTRFAFMASLAASVLAALGFLRACTVLNACPGFRRLTAPAGQAVLALSFLSLFSLELGFRPLPLTRIHTGSEVPAVYRWLAVEKLGPIVELPMGMLENFPYMYFSTYHWLPIVNGWSGFVPPTYFQIAQELQMLPSREAVEFLSALGVKGVVVHTDRLLPQEARGWREAKLADVGLDQVAAFGSDMVYRLPTVEVAHQIEVELSVPARLPAEAKIGLGLLAKGIDHHPWSQPRPLGQTRAIVEWQEAQSGRSVREEVPVELPLVIRGGEIFQIGLSVRTPKAPGPYLLTLRLPIFDLNTAPRSIELTAAPWPTSRTAPQQLKAVYELEVAPAVDNSRPFTIAVKAVNTGDAVWLAQTEGDRGAVRLGWRWFQGGQEVPGTSGREPLLYDIYPGRAYIFKARIHPPPEPGEYMLELGLVSELVTWFVDQGVAPLKVVIRTSHPVELESRQAQ